MGIIMNFEIKIVADDNFHIPIKYSTKASHLPPPTEITNKKMLTLSNVTKMATRMSNGHVCYSTEKCTEGKCKGNITILRESEETILWQCNKCLTKGQITDFKLTPHDLSNEQRQLTGPISLQLPQKQYNAVDNIRGLPSRAHTVVMAAEFEDNRTIILSGEENAFSELANTIMEEVEYDAAKGTDQKHLFSLMEKIEEALEVDIHIC